MMCGCGSTGERATDCAVFVSLTEGPMLHSCTLCILWQQLWCPPFFLFHCIQFVCCSCTLLSAAAALTLPPSFCLNHPLHLSLKSSLSLLSLLPFLARYGGIVATVNCPFCRTREERKRESEGGVK